MNGDGGDARSCLTSAIKTEKGVAAWMTVDLVRIRRTVISISTHLGMITIIDRGTTSFTNLIFSVTGTAAANLSFGTNTVGLSIITGFSVKINDSAMRTVDSFDTDHSLALRIMYDIITIR